MDDVVKSIAELIEEVADIPKERISGESLIVDDLNLSSLQIVIALAELERKFSIRISESELGKIRTVNDLAEMIKNS